MNQDMISKIKHFVGSGDTEGALNLLKKVYLNEGVLLQARYSNGKNQFLFGQIGSDEWRRIQSQVNSAIIDILDRNIEFAQPEKSKSELAKEFGFSESEIAYNRHCS